QVPGLYGHPHEDRVDEPARVLLHGREGSGDRQGRQLVVPDLRAHHPAARRDDEADVPGQRWQGTLGARVRGAQRQGALRGRRLAEVRVRWCAAADGPASGLGVTAMRTGARIAVACTCALVISPLTV